MDNKALLIGVTVAIIGGSSLFVYMKQFEKEMSGGPKIPVLIASRDIQMGETLDQSMIGVRQLPQAYVDQRHIRRNDLDSIQDVKTSMSIKANECILWSDLTTMQTQTRDLSSLIEPGMRALPVLAKDIALFSGLLRPGDRVDIVFSPNEGLMGTTKSTMTLLQNLLVLAVDADTGGKDNKNSRGRNVTVSVTPTQAQLVIHAETEGQLNVTLRNPDDIVILEKLPETRTDDIREPERRAQFSRQPLRKKDQKHHEIEQIR